MFKEFELKDIFGTQPFRGGLQVPTGALMKSDELEEGSTPRITVTSDNNGIGGYYKDVDNKNYRIFENCISVSFLGTVFYHPYRASFDMKVHCLKPLNHELVETEALYIIPALRKQLVGNDYFTQTTSTDLPYMTISLPVIENADPNHVYTVDDIDWQYMQDRIAELEQDRIAELEQDRIAELEAYLAATGLDDYELTDEDKAVLCDEKVMKTYRLGEVFSVESVNKLSIKGKNYVMDKDIVSEDGTTPYIAAISTNNGITGYSNYSANNKGDCITLSTTADSSNTVFYQEQSFIGRQQIAGIRRIDGKIMERYVGLYLTAAIRKITRQFNYANKLTKEYLKNCDILFPVIVSPDPNHTYTTDDIDFNYMERYIRAMEKLAIADVVKYKDKVIATTKQVVEQ